MAGGPDGETGKDSLNAVAALGNGNIVFFDASLGTHPYLPDRLARSRTAGLAPILMIANVFIANTTLNPNWQQDWAATKAVIAPWATDILGYEFDEIAYNGVPEWVFALAARTIRADYPAARILLIEPGQGIANVAPSYLSHATDVGIDFYYQDGATYDAAFAALQSRANVGQALWLVPEFFATGTNYDTLNAQLLAALDRYFALALGNPRVVGISPWLYAPFRSVTKSGQQLLDRTDPAFSQPLLDQHIRYGRSIVATAGRM